MSEEPPFSLVACFCVFYITTDWLSDSIVIDFLPEFYLLLVFVATEIVGSSTYLLRKDSTTASSVKLLIASSLENSKK